MRRRLRIEGNKYVGFKVQERWFGLWFTLSDTFHTYEEADDFYKKLSPLRYIKVR